MTSTAASSLFARNRGIALSLGVGLACASVITVTACSDSNNPSLPTLTAAPTPGPDAELPGVNIEMLAVSGGSGSGGNIRAGDRVTVKFKVTRDDGAVFDIKEMDRGAIMLSGPTFNYQRVIPSQSDLVDRAVLNPDGSYTYQFADPMPAQYAAPYNDTTDITTGELTGQNLLSGTYTVGVELRKDYTIEGVTLRDPGNATLDFLVGGAQSLEPRQIVGEANCFQCHSQIRVHGENRTDLVGCLLCHTTGAEDRNNPNAAGGTPGATIDFRVMIHKIHSGKHLPSVLGVTTNANGSRNYDAPAKPYQLVGFGNTVHDYSEIAYPLWPSAASPMPRDTGYGNLTGAQQDQEDAMRSGPVDCASCHGDPDGDGPLAAPAQGDLIYTQPTTAGCVSCHDDWVPELPYTANTTTMPAQRDDASCTQCHKESGTPLDIRDAHLHPLRQPAIAAGLTVDITGFFEVGGDGDGRFDPGEGIQVSFTVEDANGPVDASTLRRIELVLNGPTVNPNLVHVTQISPAALTGGGPSYTFDVPESLALEAVGESLAGSLQSFATARTPHWTTSPTYVFLVDGTTGTSTLASEVRATQNYIDLMPGGGALFADGDYAALSPGLPGTREVVRVAWVQGDRLWLSSRPATSIGSGAASRPVSNTGLRNSHAINATIARVTVTEIPATDYTLDPTTGVINELNEFGSGEVLVSYTTNYVVPEAFPGTFNESPDLDERAGDWRGLPLLSGTYHLGLYANRSVSYTNPFGSASADNTSYVEASQASVKSLLFGDATAVTEVQRIDSAQSCNACHSDIQFHGGNRQGYAACILCHGVAGAEDAPRYVYPSTTDTTGVTIDFRTMLHKIHHGKELANAATYTVNGFRGSPHTYEHVGFPVFDGGTLDCAKCHGATNTAWQEPASRNHPAQVQQTGAWRMACNSCHDSDAEIAHALANTAPNGGEACAICHGPGENEDVRKVHLIR